MLVLKKKKPKFSHLSFDDRMTIQACLNKRMSLDQVAAIVHRCKSTVYREIIRNSIIKPGSVDMTCSYRSSCMVCNKCNKSGYCKFTKIYYNCEQAELHSNVRSSTNRSAPYITDTQIKAIDDIVSEGVKLGQSIHHIYIVNPELQSICSERTIRRLCEKRYLTVKPFQLRRYVRYKHKLKDKPKEAPKLKDFSKIIGRNYNDYLAFLSKHKRVVPVQFDSVIGKKTDKRAVLTINWKDFNFQIGLLIEKGSSQSVMRILNKLMSKFSEEEINKLFSVCICDNGTEFTTFYDLEKNGLRKIKTFYTRPYRSTDKSECERNHEFFRYIYPKGKTLDTLTQSDLDEAFSNINSCVRKSKDDRTPYELMVNRFGKDLVNRLGITKIDKRSIRLKK